MTASGAAEVLPEATVVFDRDGTLLDFYEMFHRFVVDLHHDEGVRPPPREQILAYSYWTAITSGELHIGRVRVLDRVNEVARRYMTVGRLYPGAPAMLASLAAAGVRLTVVSSWVGTGPTVELLERHGVRGGIGPVLTRDDLPEHEAAADDVRCKTVLARRALAELGHRPEHPLYVVGDTGADVALGRRLGAVVIGVRTGNGRMLPERPPGGPDTLLDSVAHLSPGLLGRLRPRPAPQNGAGQGAGQGAEGGVG